MKITLTRLRKLISEAIVDPRVRSRYPSPADIINGVSSYLEPSELSKLKSMFETDNIEDVNSALAILNSVYSMFEDEIPDELDAIPIQKPGSRYSWKKI